MDAINDTNTILGTVVSSETESKPSVYYRRMQRSRMVTNIVLGACIATAVVLRIAAANIDND